MDGINEIRIANANDVVVCDVVVTDCIEHKKRTDINK
jgi:hypothetical protein